jgi:hypothetical protein
MSSLQTLLLASSLPIVPGQSQGTGIGSDFAYATITHGPSEIDVPAGTIIDFWWNGTTSSNVTNPISLYLVSGPRPRFRKAESVFVAWIAS